MGELSGRGPIQKDGGTPNSNLPAGVVRVTITQEGNALKDQMSSVS